MMEEIEFDYPERVTTLERVPADLHECYCQQPDGSFAVRPRLRARFAECRTELQAKDEEARRIKAERDAAREENRKAQEHLREALAQEAIGAALEAGGCLPRFVAGATAMLMKELSIEIDASSGEPVAMLVGGGSIDHAVKIWLHSEVGSEFCAPKPLPGSGYFNGLYVDFRKQLH
jgi:hypothetical protein